MKVATIFLVLLVTVSTFLFSKPFAESVENALNYAQSGNPVTTMNKSKDTIVDGMTYYW